MNVIIVHGSGLKRKETRKGVIPSNKRSWILWIKKKLEEKNIERFAPLMPKNWDPDYFEWKKEFEKIKVDESSILIGHSAGTTFLVRWLGETKRKIKKLILVASWKQAWLKSSQNKEFCNFEIDENVKRRIREIIIFTSDGDKVIIDSSKLYVNKLGGKLICLKGRGHFIELHMKTNEFPELLKEILK